MVRWEGEGGEADRVDPLARALVVRWSLTLATHSSFAARSLIAHTRHSLFVRGSPRQVRSLLRGLGKTGTYEIANGNEAEYTGGAGGACE